MHGEDLGQGHTHALTLFFCMLIFSRKLLHSSSHVISQTLQQNLLYKNVYSTYALAFSMNPTCIRGRIYIGVCLGVRDAFFVALTMYVL
jgi:hypothetical protein